MDTLEHIFYFAYPSGVIYKTGTAITNITNLIVSWFDSELGLLVLSFKEGFLLPTEIPAMSITGCERSSLVKLRAMFRWGGGNLGEYGRVEIPKSQTIEIYRISNEELLTCF